MAFSPMDQATVAAFAFGTVTCASLGTVLFHLRGGTLSLFRGGLRLVLAGFLLLSSLWAIDGFVASFIDKRSSSGCQIAVAFAGAFDQLARITLEEFLFWAMKCDTRATLGVLLPQIVIFLRFVLGGVFVGVQRPQFNPVCVATNLLWPIGVAVLCADAFIVVALLTRASSVGAFRDMRAKTPVGCRSRGLVLTTIALGFWIPLSVPMILGIQTFGIATRTALPAVGVLIVIGVVAFYFRSLVSSQPGVTSRKVPYLKQFPGLSETTSQPPKPESQDVSTIDPSYPPKLSVRPREGTTRTVNGSVGVATLSGSNPKSLPIISRPSPGQAISGVGGMPVKGELFPPMRSESLSMKQEIPIAQPVKKAFVKGGKLIISHPIVPEGNLDEANPLTRIATVDLLTAVRQDKERRNIASQSTVKATTGATPPTLMANPYEQQNSKNLDRRQVVGGVPQNQARDTNLTSIEEHSSQGTSSAVLTVPKIDSGAVRQRSPKHISQCFQEAPSPAALAQRSPPSQKPSSSVPLIPPPRSPLRHLPPHDSIATALHGQMKPFNNSEDQIKAYQEKVENETPLPFSHQTSTTSSSTKEGASKKGLVDIPSNRKNILVPQVPPLSPSKLLALGRHASDSGSGGQYRKTELLSSIGRSSSVKHNIRPSRQRLITPPADDEANLPKLPIQLRGTTGLPSNPKASPGNSHNQAVTPPKGNDYNNPSRNKGTNNEITADLAIKADGNEIQSRHSVVHRPRPVPRKLSSVPTPVAETKSMEPPRDGLPSSSKDLTSRPEPSGLHVAVLGPSQLPPPASKGRHLQPAHSRVPMSSKLATNTQAQESMVTLTQKGPDLRSIRLGSGTAREDNQPDPESKVVDESKHSNPVPPGVLEPSSSDRLHLKTNKYISRFSIATTLSPEDPPSAYLQSPALAVVDKSQEGLRRKSSPVLPVNDVQGSATPASIRTDGSGANWIAQSSMQRSDEPQIPGIILAPKYTEVLSTSVEMPTRTSYPDSLLPNEEDDGKETVTFMLAPSTYYPTNAAHAPPRNKQDGGAGVGDKGSSWHRRVGENPPTFSDRRSMQSRRSPKPPPLELSKPTKSIKRSPPPMSPLETPQQVLGQIQEQLNKIEEADMDDTNLERRMSLLENIEMEMDMEGNRWQKMRDDLARASFSTVDSTVVSPVLEDYSLLPARILQSPAVEVVGKSSIANDTRVSKGERDTGRPRSSVLFTADEIQISRLDKTPAQFQVITTKETPRLLKRTAQNGTSLTDGKQSPATTLNPSNNTSKPSISIDYMEQPRTQQEELVYHEEHDLRKQTMVDTGSKRTNSETPPWNNAPESTTQSSKSPSSSLSPITHRSRENACVGDTKSQDSSPKSLKSQARSPGLLRTMSQSPQSSAPAGDPVTRPRTMRPPRKSRRISSLPDILERPEPVERHGDTVRIVESPAGERLDTATLSMKSRMLPVDVRFGLSEAPPTYSSLEMQTQDLQSRQQPSSSFNHHAGSVTDGGDSLDLGVDDDDLFDEATLWEIASLLRSDKVPSRDSLLPRTETSYVGPFSAQRHTLAKIPSSTSRAQEVARKDVPEDIKEGKPPRPMLHRESSSPTVPSPEAVLWVNNARVPSTLSKENQGLLQNDKIWATYVKDQSSSTIRAASRPAKTSGITSNSLWSQISFKAGTSPALTRLWSAKMKPQESTEPVIHVKEISRPTTPEPKSLWSTATSTKIKRVIGLPQPTAETWVRYNNLGKMNARPRSRNVEQPTIKSRSLWKPNAAREEQVQASEETTLPSARVHDKKGTTSAKAVGTVNTAQPASSDIMPTATSPVKSSSSKDAVVCIEEQSTLDVDNTHDWRDDIITPSPLGNDLWVPISTLPVDEDYQGLFQVQQRCHPNDQKFGSTSENSPPASKTRRAPRSVRRSLPALESQTLWTPPTRQSCQQDWVTLSSVRPSTPPPDQLSSESGSESPSSYTSSVYSNDTGESTAASFLTGQASVQLKPQFVTDADWTATLHGAGPATRPRDEIASSVPNWAAALHGAPERLTQPNGITPPLKKVNEVGSGKMAGARERSEAVEASPVPSRQYNPFSTRRQTQHGGFDPARHHPVFDVYFLDTSNGDCHPAAQGYMHTMVNKNPDLIQR